jgi:hypothetical protein
VPSKNLCRHLTELLNWDFLCAQIQALRSHIGQPLLDPVVFFKLMLVNRLENLVSDHRLIKHYSMRLNILYFLCYEMEDLPRYSTVHLHLLVSNYYCISCYPAKKVHLLGP